MKPTLLELQNALEVSDDPIFTYLLEKEITLRQSSGKKAVYTGDAKERHRQAQQKHRDKIRFQKLIEKSRPKWAEGAKRRIKARELDKLDGVIDVRPPKKKKVKGRKERWQDIPKLNDDHLLCR